MTDIQNTEPDIEDRDANIRMMVQHIIKDRMEMMFAEFDRLHRRGIHDNDMVKALTYLEEKDILESYAEWAEIDLREDDNTTTSPDGVTDPGGSETNRQMAEQYAHTLNVQTALDAIVDQLIEERERELYFDFKYDGEDSMLDGPVNLVALAEAVTKALGK